MELYRALLCIVACSVLMGGSLTAYPQEQNRPYRIGRIRIVRQEVFDDRRDGWFGRFANQLHTMTRERIIRNELLFKEGDLYDEDVVDETERNLRALSIIGDVAISADTVRNRRVNLTVYTRDRWTLGLNPTYKKEGGITNLVLNLNDDNLLGNAQSLTIGYNYRSDRVKPSGVEMIFVEPRLFGSRTGTHIQYKNSEDATTGSISLERSYYSEEATWAGGAYTDFGKLRVRRYEQGALVFDDYLLQQNQNAWFSRSFGDRRQKFRFGAGYVRTRRQTGTVPATFYDRLDLLNFSASISSRVFYRGRYVESFGRVEDIPLGYVVNVIFGPNFHRPNANAPDYYGRLDAQYAMGMRQRYYASLGVSASSFIANHVPREATLEYTLVQHWRATARTTAVARVNYIKGYNWSELRQLVLGSPSGLRGYDAFAFSGQQQFLVNLQYRLFPPLSFWIFQFGGEFFLDSGTAWRAGDPLGRQQFHTSIGFGIRVENEAQQGAGLLRIDFPFNLDNHRFTEIVFSANQLIKAFSDIGFIPPNALR